MSRFSTKDAIVLAYSNPTFMRELLANPADFADEFGLEPKAVEILAGMDPEEVSRMSAAVTDPIEFARASGAVAQLAKDGY